MSGCSHKCGGACCKVFNIPSLNINNLKQKKEQAQRDAERMEKSGIKLDQMAKDKLTVYEMLIPLTHLQAFEVNPHYFYNMMKRTRVPFGLSQSEAAKWMDEDSYGHSSFFSCKHIQDDGLCAIYETRPSMCREYPNDTFCGHNPDCTAVNKERLRTELDGSILRSEQYGIQEKKDIKKGF